MPWTASLYRIPADLAGTASSPADIKTLIEGGVPELLASQTVPQEISPTSFSGFSNVSNDGFPAEAGDLLVTVVTEGIGDIGIIGVRSDSIYECDTKAEPEQGDPVAYYYKFPYYYLP